MSCFLVNELCSTKQSNTCPSIYCSAAMCPRCADKGGNVPASVSGRPFGLGVTPDP